nr:MAG TPA: hypothetical protein [Caudoviricetes sp.]
MADSNWVRVMAQEIRENPAQFLREAFKEGGFLADTEFKPYAEAGKPFVMRLEEACLPYVEIDYWRPMPAGGVMLNQLVASPHVFQGETEPRWTLNAHYQTIYHEGLPWNVVTEGEVSDMAESVWEEDAASILTRRGTRKDAWLFPYGTSKLTEGSHETVLHSRNY